MLEETCGGKGWRSEKEDLLVLAREIECDVLECTSNVRFPGPFYNRRHGIMTSIPSTRR
jgi:hypothetical protein